MCSWHDNIISYHEEMDNWHIDEGSLKIITEQTAQGDIEIPQLQYGDNEVDISDGGNHASPTGAGRDEDRQKSHSYSGGFTDAGCRQNSKKQSHHFIIIAPFGHSCMTDFFRVSEGEHPQNHEYVSKPFGWGEQ